LNGHRLHRHFATFLVIVIVMIVAGSLLLLTGCQGLSGTNGGGTVGVGSGSLAFGAVPIGSSKTVADTLSNNTSAAITISSIQGLGSGFSVTGMTLPLVLAAGQSVSFSVEFQPTAAGNPSTTISFDGQNGQAYVSGCLWKHQRRIEPDQYSDPYEQRWKRSHHLAGDDERRRICHEQPRLATHAAGRKSGGGNDHFCAHRSRQLQRERHVCHHHREDKQQRCA
jgi:hypothetical protein